MAAREDRSEFSRNMQSVANKPLPKAVHMIGERIGLNYRIRRKEAAEAYVGQNQQSRLQLDQLKKSYYSLNESRTKNKAEGDKATKHRSTGSVRNLLKLNARIRRRLYKLTPEERERLRYSDFEKIHSLWLQYVDKVLENSDPSNIFRIDLHGCHLSCTASKNPSLVGSEGIVVQETKNTFLVIKQNNRLVTLPKRESIFEFDVDKKRYRIHGCNLMFTSQARTKVKYKHKRFLSNV